MVGREPDLESPFDIDEFTKCMYPPKLALDDEAYNDELISATLASVHKSSDDELISATLASVDKSSDDKVIKATSLTGNYHLRNFSSRDYYHELAMPLIQVFRVDIFTNFTDDKHCEIYGSIQVFQGTRYCSDLYRRDCLDFETMKEKQGTLSLSGPPDDPIFPTMTTNLKFCIEDRSRGVKVVDGELNLNPVNDDSYDRLLEKDVLGPHGFARVYYVVFQFGGVRIIDIKVTKTDNDNDNGTDIFGSIVARYANDRMYRKDDQPGKWLETRMFDRPSDKPLHVVVGTSIELSRNLVVAQLYSPLEIKVNLCDSNKEVMCGCLQFPDIPFFHDPQYIQTDYARVEVQVQRKSAYSHLYRGARRKEFQDKKYNDMSKMVEELHNQYLSASRVPGFVPEPRTSAGVEIFTVCVGGIAKQISSLSGIILVIDGGSPFSLYNRNDEDREILPTSGLASIECNYRSVTNFEFEIEIYLKDPDNKLEVSRGVLGWDLYTIGSNPDFLCYTKRMCSLVRGDDGYAAVHYSIFWEAYEVFVKVELKSTTHGYANVPILLYGTLLGRYGGYEYTTSYDQKYYQSRLFDRARDKSIEVKVDEKIALLKSLVTVPFQSSLIIESKLGIMNSEETICGLQEFRPMLETQSLTIHGKHYAVELSVKFIEQ